MQPLFALDLNPIDFFFLPYLHFHQSKQKPIPPEIESPLESQVSTNELVNPIL